jgi:two-component system, cell cycle response regulator DivK
VALSLELRRAAPKLVLLVDPDADTRRMYGEHLRLARWHFDEAADGREALVKAIASPPDVIVTETRLPGISGLDLCEILRRDAATQSTEIVILTGGILAADIARAYKVGASAVLVKPCLPETLMAEIGRLLTKSWDRTGTNGARSIAMTNVLPREAAASSRISRPLSKTHDRRDTEKPPAPPPSLLCPLCDYPLVYLRSHLGGVSERHPEQWDVYECNHGCGRFEYRQRTRKLRKLF